MDGPGIPPGVIAIFVIFGLIAVGGLIFRISLASRMAQRANLDPGEAALTTALSQDGLAATYVAANLADRAQRGAAVATTEQRLRELENLHGQGLVNDAEYAEQRQRILGAI